MAKKVFIGVGHGGSDPGAIGSFKEKDLNLSIAKACRDELVRHGVLVKMSRTKDENDPLREEIDEANAYAPALAVDIHINAGGGDGAEAYYHHGGGIGKTLAENILKEVVALGQNSRGAKIRTNSAGKDYYGFIRETSCPACIIEACFIDNATDIKVIDTAAEQRAMGRAVAKGILKTLNIKYIKETEDMKFKDVPETHWAYKAIEELTEEGILTGYEDGTFKPDQPVTRAEVAAIVSRLKSK